MLAVVYWLAVNFVQQGQSVSRIFMNIFKVLIVIGFIIAGIGWCLAAFLDVREIGRGLFFLGFFSAVAGIVGTQLSMKFEGKLRAPGIGLKVSALGFGICCLSGLAAIFFIDEKTANYIFYGGAFIGVIGILIMFFNIGKTKDGDLFP